VPRVAGEGLLRVGFDDVAYEAYRRDLAERIYEPCRNVGNEGEVPELERLEAGEVRAVEAQADRKEFAADVRRRNGQAVPAAEKIGELQVDELDALLFNL